MSAILTYSAPSVQSGRLLRYKVPRCEPGSRRDGDLGNHIPPPRRTAMARPTPPFDDRDGFIWYDGGLVPWREAKLHVLTHGLHYASCVFEGERVYNGKVFRLEDHNRRLINSAEIL